MNPIKAHARKLVFNRTKGLIGRAGEVPTLQAAAASLRATGSTSRAALTDVHIPLFKWSKLRNPPDPEILMEILTLIKPLDNPDHTKMIFTTYGESEDGTGAAWLYLEAIEEVAKKANNRFTREILQIAAKARSQLGTKHTPVKDPEKSKEVSDFVKSYIKEVIL